MKNHRAAIKLGEELLKEVEEEVKAASAQLLAAQNLLTEGQREHLASELGKRIADYYCLAWGGQQVYIPKDRHRRAAMLCREFTGNNHVELARKYGLCIQTVYRILRQERANRRVTPRNLLDFL